MTMTLRLLVILLSAALGWPAFGAEDSDGLPILSVTGAEPQFFDRDIQVRVSALPPGGDVSLIVVAVDAGEQTWRSENTYVAAADGTLDIARDAPKNGSYSGVHSMGPFWSMSGAKRFRTGNNADLTISVKVGADIVAEQTLSWVSHRAGAGHRATVIRPTALKPSADYDQATYGDLVANLYLPASEQESLPAIMVVGGSGGGFNSERAAMLASHGYAVLDVAYFGAADRPEYFLATQPLEYFMEAVSFLEAHPRVDAGRIGVMGKSYGAQLALLLASYEPRIKLVIAEAPSSFVTGTVSTRANGPYYSAWSFRGVEFPFIKGGDPRVSAENPRQITVERAGHEALDTLPEAGRAAIPVERINGPVLLITGEADTIWPATPMADQLTARTAKNGFRHLVKHARYPDAGHNLAGGQQAYGVPNLPPKDRGATRGGSRNGNSAAGAAAWKEVLAFLDMHF